MNFKLVISDPKTRKAYQKEIEQKASGLLGKKIGEKVSGSPFGLTGYELEVTGGSDREGFPMRKDVDGTARKRIVLSSGPGFHPKKKGQRKRRSVRGNTISPAIVQVNLKVTGYGQKSIEELLGVKKEEPKEDKEKTQETQKEEKTAEQKSAEKQEKPSEAPKEQPAGEKKEAEEPKKEKPAEQPAGKEEKPKEEDKK